MSVIRILAEDVSNRIAAGEVVERPASVVKELAENALDAGARQVSIAIERGGRSLIQVADDGCGMDAEDALLCLEAHATSKIRETVDIEHIGTMGFRGEALPSIASVSRFSLRTRTGEADAGTEVICNGGVMEDVTPAGCAVGTVVTVRNLFYNQPARRKFLRTVATEESHIEETVLMLALGNPDVGFDLTFDRRAVFSVRPANEFRTRAAMLLGRDLTDAMLPVSFADEEVEVTGLVARPGFTRRNRREQRTFVNGRPVTADPVYFAVREAYHTLVMKGRYPPVLLFLRVPPENVDVNVHPAKREVRFRHGRAVSRAVGTAIRQALRRQVVDATPTPAPLPPDVPPPSALPLQQPALMLPPARPIVGAAAPLATPRPIPPATPLPDPSGPPAPTAEVVPDRPAGTSVSAADRDEIGQLRIVGEVAGLYLVAEGPRGMVLIDQHAAHERVLFERLLCRLRQDQPAGQGLLIPITVDFAAADADVLRRHADRLRALGFEMEHFGGNTFLFSGVPAELPAVNVVSVIRDIIDDLRREADAPRSALSEERIAQAACKAAVKAHDQLERREVETLLEELRRTELPYTCPHGRPTMINLPWKELEKRFGRRQ